jgi:heterodisulfide reductase subunit D
VFCPSGINTVALGISAREYLGKKNMMPPNYKLAKDSVDKLRNVLGLPNEERGMWNEYSYTPASIMEKGSDYVYFVGCMASFSPAVQDIPVAVNEILTRAGLNYTILAGEEWCCGYPLIIGGMRDGVEELVNHNIEVIKKLGASTVIFSCPSCFLTWRMEYPENGIRLLHHTQLINQLIKDNKIKLGHINAKVTYHDPCDLGRKSGIYIEPREIIKNIPGIEFIELKENREKSLCCGGGGDVEIIDENFPALVGSKVINMADESGVQYLVTACQQCKRTFMKAAKKVGSNIRVVDIAELVLLSMENA